MGNICDCSKAERVESISDGSVIHITTREEFQEELALARNKLILIDFYAQWCRPCKTIAPQVEQLSRGYSDVVFLKIDVDELNDIAEQYHVASLPTFIFIRRGKLVCVLEGSDFERLHRFVKKYRV